MNVILKEEIDRKILELSSEVSSKVPVSTHLSNAVAQALCYIQRCIREKPVGYEFQPRILVVKTCPDSPAQYNAIMNCIFAAQKDSVPIDSCVLWNDSSFLQQASDMTSGVYLRIPDPRGLLQYLLWTCLPDAPTRQLLCMPKTKEVDYRAACVCHSRLVETGYVCSTCLSSRYLS
jgi:transcription initiation factor TFIIH subunit 3